MQELGPLALVALLLMLKVCPTSELPIYDLYPQYVMSLM